MTRRSWGTYTRQLQLHARDRGYRARIAGALQRIRDIDAEGLRLFLAISGGKDSVALAGLLCEAGLQPHGVHVNTDLNTPGTLDTAIAAATELGFALDLYEPTHDVWELLAQPFTDKCDPLFDKASSGTLLVAYTYDHHDRWDGSWTGMRADESRGRAINSRVRGALYQLKSDQKWIAQPMLWLTARDVLAYAHVNRLPIHPHYALAYERLGVSPEMSRVDCLVTPPGVAALGAHAVARVLYPDLWGRIEEARPALRATR